MIRLKFFQHGKQGTGSIVPDHAVFETEGDAQPFRRWQNGVQHGTGPVEMNLCGQFRRHQVRPHVDGHGILSQTCRNLQCGFQTRSQGRAFRFKGGVQIPVWTVRRMGIEKAHTNRFQFIADFPQQIRFADDPCQKGGGQNHMFCTVFRQFQQIGKAVLIVQFLKFNIKCNGNRGAHLASSG